jgi:hypothetical protein
VLFWRRVTRLGEFSPFGRLFKKGILFGNYKSIPKIGLLVLKKMNLSYIGLSVNVLGYILGDFFIKLSGHPCLGVSHSV